jgi:hypothetical protein
MIQMTINGQLIADPREDTPEHDESRDMGQQLVRLQEFIAHDRRYLETLLARPPQEDLTGQLAYL